MSCRDRGKGGADAGALCLSSLGARHLAWPAQTLTASQGHQDKHKAPALPRIHPLSLQDGSRWCLSFPHSVVKDHQVGNGRVLS